MQARRYHWRLLKSCGSVELTMNGGGAMETQQYEIGMIGLGVMGRNMLLNMADHGFSAAGYDKDAAKVEALQKESAGKAVRSVADIKDFVGLLRRPRAVMMLVPAGPPVDSVIGDLLPYLEKGD